MEKKLELRNVTAMLSFATVATVGSFSGAAKELSCSKAAVSRQIATLEESIGVKLLNRTTRKVTLTPAGKEFYARCAHIVDEVNETNQLMAGMVSTPRGTLNVNAPVVFTLFRTAELIPRFVKRFPEVKVNFTLSDRKIDLLNEGFDVAFWFGESYDESLDSVKLISFDMVVCGSPAYFEKNTVPTVPSDLKNHECIVETHLSRPGEWVLSKNQTIRIRNQRLKTNSVRIAREGILEDIGIAFLPSFIVEDDIREGRLQAVLTEHVNTEIPLYAIYPKNQYLLAKVKAFIDFLNEVIAGSDELLAESV